MISDLAWWLQRVGTEFKFAITGNVLFQATTIGIIPRTTDWQGGLDPANLVVFDDRSSLSTRVDRLRTEGIPVAGGTRLTDCIGTDRHFGRVAVAYSATDASAFASDWSSEPDGDGARSSPIVAPARAPTAAPLLAMFRLNSPPTPAPTAAPTAAYFARLNARDTRVFIPAVHKQYG